MEYAIKLTRSYAFEGDFTKAYDAFERYLGKLSPNDARVPKTYGALLVDLGKFDDALLFLLPLRERYPDDLEVLGTLIRAYARLNNRARMLELIAEMASRRSGTIPVRLELAEALYQASDLEAAGLIFGQVFKAEPSNPFATIGLARVAIALFQTREAYRCLQTVRPTAAAERLFLLTWAEYHQLVGEYTQAKLIYRTFLQKDENDGEVRLALARLYEFIREDEKAKAEYAKISSDASQYRTARLGIVSTLMTQRRFGESIEAARQVLAEAPTDAGALGALARVLAKSGNFAEAEAICRDYLRTETRNEAGMGGVRLVLAKILLDEGKLAESATEFEIAMNRPTGRVALAFYGVARVRAA